MKVVAEYGSTSINPFPVTTILGRYSIALSKISREVRLIYPVAARRITRPITGNISFTECFMGMDLVKERF